MQQQEAAQAVVGDGAPSQRMRVFVQMVYDLKNNRARKHEQAAADGALGRLQKWAKGLEARATHRAAHPDAAEGGAGKEGGVEEGDELNMWIMKPVG